MLNCRQVVAHADALLAEELDIWQRLGVRFHLAMCRHCRRYVRQLRVLIRTLAKVRKRLSAAEAKDILNVARRAR